MDGYMDELVDKGMDGRMVWYLEEWMEGWTGEWIRRNAIKRMSGDKLEEDINFNHVRSERYIKPTEGRSFAY